MWTEMKTLTKEKGNATYQKYTNRNEEYLWCTYQCARMAKERIRELENRSVETYQTHMLRESTMKI